MIEQTGQAVKFYFHYLSAGVSKTGIAVTVDVYRTSDNVKVVDNLAATEIGTSGIYFYSYTPATAGDYLAVGKTADTTVDQKHLPGMWSIGRAGVDNLDAPISAAGPTVEDIADQVWDEPLAGHVTAGSIGEVVRLMRGHAGGRWVIEDNQFMLYDADSVTLLETFNLAPVGGSYTSRTPV